MNSVSKNSGNPSWTEGIVPSRLLLLLHLALGDNEAVVLIAVLHTHPRIVGDTQLFLQRHCDGDGEAALALDDLVQVAGLDAYSLGELFLLDAALLQLLAEYLARMYGAETGDSIVVHKSLIQHLQTLPS